MKRLWLVRHASTAWTGKRWCGTTNLPLDAAGQAAAAELATTLVDRLHAPMELYCSPLMRARQTAESLAAALDAELHIDESLREIDFGRIEGLEWDALEREHPSLAASILEGSAEVDWPGGEMAAAIQSRARGVWTRLEALEVSTVVLVSHGGFIRAVLQARALEGDLLAPAAAVALERDGQDWRRVDAAG